jgi:hypothetical protein
MYCTLATKAICVQLTDLKSVNLSVLCHPCDSSGFRNTNRSQKAMQIFCYQSISMMRHARHTLPATLYAQDEHQANHQPVNTITSPDIGLQAE